MAIGGTEPHPEGYGVPLPTPEEAGGPQAYLLGLAPMPMSAGAQMVELWLQRGPPSTPLLPVALTFSG